MKIKILFKSLLFLLLIVPNITLAQSLWYPTTSGGSTYLKPVVNTWGASTTALIISGTGYNGTNCLQISVTGLVSATGAACGSGGGYATIQDEGSALTQRTVVNFIGTTISCVDNAGSSRTDCTVTGGGGGGSDPFTHSPDAGYSATTTAMAIGTSTPNYLAQLTIGSSTAPQLVLRDNSLTTAGWFQRNVGGNLLIGTSTPGTFATSTNSTVSITGNGRYFNLGDAGAFQYDVDTSTTTIPNLNTGNLTSQNDPGVFNFLDIPMVSAANNTPEAAMIGFPSVNATNTLSIWGLATGVVNQVKNFAVSIGTSTQPSSSGQAVGETHFQISSTNATTTVSCMVFGTKGCRYIFQDTSGGTCTEITTQGGSINSKAVTCPTN